MSEAIGKALNLAEFSSSQVLANEYKSIMRDRRLRIIFFKSLNSAKKDPILLLRFSWASLVVFFMGSAIACHRLLMDLAGAYVDRLSYNSKQVAVTA